MNKEVIDDKIYCFNLIIYCNIILGFELCLIVDVLKFLYI